MLKSQAKIKHTENKILKKRIESIGRVASGSPIVKVGYPLTEGGGIMYPARNVPVASVAFWHEFGTRFMPARPFFRPTMTKNAKAYRKLLARNIKQAFGGKGKILDGMKKIGMKAVADIQRAITDLKNPPLKPYTIKRKKSGNPLIDTGLMRSSTTYIVEEKGKKK